MTKQSPPTVSGVIVISGSNDFLVGQSDFPIVTLAGDVLVEEVVIEGPSIGFVSDPLNIKLTSTPVTTSGLIVAEIFPNAGFTPVPVINARLFPVISGSVFVRVFPEEGRRIFPVLPQNSILTPGD